MSSQRIKYIKQFFPIEAKSYDTGTKTYTITANNHGLFTDIDIYLVSEPYNTTYKTTANVTSANTFTAFCYQPLEQLSHYYINGYLSGQTGVKEEQTLPRATGTETVIQSYVTGTGGAAYNIDVSLDKTHWIQTANLTHTSTSGDTGFITISPGWAYYRPNVTSIGANTNLVIISGE